MQNEGSRKEKEKNTEFFDRREGGQRKKAGFNGDVEARQVFYTAGKGLTGG